jgi:hypothetical protein
MNGGADHCAEFAKNNDRLVTLLKPGSHDIKLDCLTNLCIIKLTISDVEIARQ